MATMYEHMHNTQMSLEREMKRRRETLWGEGYPLHDLEDVTRVDTEPTVKEVKEVANVDVKRVSAITRLRAMLNLVRLSPE